MNALELTGRALSHLVQCPDSGMYLHPKVVRPITELVDAAKSQGFQPKIISGFRDLKKQVDIWNKKILGRSKLFSRSGEPVSIENLSLNERVTLILNWSAIPGGSRHHWGTDIDIIGTRFNDDYSYQLIYTEFQEGGHLHEFAQWLKHNMYKWDFYLPYEVDQGGIAPEPWHISFWPIASLAQRQLEQTDIKEAIEESNLIEKPYVLANLNEIYIKYVMNVSKPQHKAEFKLDP